MTSKDLYIKEKLKEIQDLRYQISLMQDIIHQLFMLYFYKVGVKK